MTRRIAFLLGKPPKPGLFPDILSRLQAQGVSVRLHLPHQEAPVMAAPDELVVHRGLRRDVLERLLGEEGAGTTFCNPVAASLQVEDRFRIITLLGRAGVPVPASLQTDDWQQVVHMAQRGPLVIKARDGAAGRGVGVSFIGPGTCPLAPPIPGPWQVQEHVQADGTDRKLYVVGGTCRGLLKPWPRQGASGIVPFTPAAELLRIGRAAGVAAGLEIFGVDVVQGPDGPVVVDVNAFPGSGGVAGAAGLIAGYLSARLGPSDASPQGETEFV